MKANRIRGIKRDDMAKRVQRDHTVEVEAYIRFLIQVLDAMISKACSNLDPECN